MCYRNTVRSESRCALRLRYVDLVVTIEARGHHFQQLFVSAQRLSESISAENVCEST
jgi:hypothetical protein